MPINRYRTIEHLILDVAEMSHFGKMLQLVIYVQDGESFFYDADEGQRIGSFKRDLGRKLDTTTPFKLMYGTFLE